MTRKFDWIALIVVAALIVAAPSLAIGGTTITGTVTATPTYAVNVDSGASLAYGSHAAGETSVTPTGLTQTVITNTGNDVEAITITGASAIPDGGGTNWTPVATAPGANEYRWHFVEGSTNVTPVSTATTLAASVAVSGSKTYDTYLDMPSSYTTVGGYTFQATVAATAP